MYFVAGSVEESGVDECDARCRNPDALCEVECGPTFLVHDADFHGVGGETEKLLDTSE